MKNITWLLLFLTTIALANYDAKPLSTPKGGTGDASFTANLPLIGNGTGALSQGTVSGNTTKFATSTGTLTSGHCVDIDSNGNFIDAGAACGSGSGTVSSVSVVSANGFAGTVATSTTTPAITLSTSVTGILYGNGTSVAAAVSSNFPTIGVAQGGTGDTSATAYGVITGGTTSTGAFQNAGTGSAGQVYVSGGSAALGTWESASQSPATVANGGDAAYAITAANFHIRSGTTLTAGRTYTLPACTASNIGERHEIKNLPAQTFNVTVAPNGSDTIDGSATYTLSPGDSVPVICAVFASVGNWDVE